MLGVPRVQPLNDYRLIFMVKKGLDDYMAKNGVRAGLAALGSRCQVLLCGGEAATGGPAAALLPLAGWTRGLLSFRRRLAPRILASQKGRWGALRGMREVTDGATRHTGPVMPSTRAEC